ncbi:MAG: 3-dehydroquinate synthase, partial [Ktedonobacterales bacterium]|nr:3-dehydroquinate synthase [Ktedonobacterales bacterium]
MMAPFAERIFVLGLPASGKTTTGARLAARLGWAFADVDALVERHARHSIPDIFARAGEARFRALEHAALTEYAARDRIVIATGGGIGERPENLALMRERGWLVTLLVTPETAWQRAVAAAESTGVPLGESRPLLAGAHPLAQLRALDARRRAWYETADEVVVADEATPDALAARIVAGLVGRGLLPPDGALAHARHVHTAAPTTHYEVVVAWGALATLGERLRALRLPPRLHLVADATVADLYEPALMPALMRAGFTPYLYRVPPGEASKSRECLAAIQDWLAERRADRGEALVAIGGGVVGDLAGFAAATYLRGMPLIHVPTSLLAQVDASVGGKVAIDHPRGKNLLGAFYPPLLVVADPATLLTLSPRALTEGWAEVVKHGVALDAAYFERVEREAEALLACQPAPLVEAVAGSVALKAAVVEADEREAEGGRRALLNYGHTIGHAIEAVTGYGTWPHGEAVAVGMAVAARLGRRLGITPSTVVERQEALLTRLGLPIRADGLSVPELLRAAMWDKKARGGQARWVVPSALGTAALHSDIADEDVRAALLEVGAVDGAPPP